MRNNIFNVPGVLFLDENGNLSLTTTACEAHNKQIIYSFEEFSHALPFGERDMLPIEMVENHGLYWQQILNEDGKCIVSTSPPFKDINDRTFSTCGDKESVMTVYRILG